MSQFHFSIYLSFILFSEILFFMSQPSLNNYSYEIKCNINSRSPIFFCFSTLWPSILFQIFTDKIWFFFRDIYHEIFIVIMNLTFISKLRSLARFKSHTVRWENVKNILLFKLSLKEKMRIFALIFDPKITLSFNF